MKETIVLLEVSRRQPEKEKFLQTQQSVMNRDRVEKDARHLHRSVSSFNDRHMVNALSEVREFKVTHNESLSVMVVPWKLLLVKIFFNGIIAKASLSLVGH